MEFVEGHKLTALPAELPISRPDLARRFLDLYFRMAFGNLFLHADLHPGNVLVHDDGRFCLLDTGLVFEVPRHYVRKFLRVGVAMGLRDGGLLADAYLDGLETTPEQASAVRRDIGEMMAMFAAKSFREVEFGKLFLDILRMLRRNGIHLDSEWTGLMLSDMTFEGLAKMLDNEIDIMVESSRLITRHASANAQIQPGDPIIAAAIQRGLAVAA